MTTEEGPTRHYDGWGGRVGKTVEESTSWWPPTPTPSSDAPNIIVVLLDDMGFSDIGPLARRFRRPRWTVLPARAFATPTTTRRPCAPRRARRS